MVSPSKKQKYLSSVASITTTTTGSNKSKVIKSSRSPLKNYKFYLDIEKHNVSATIENQIKNLGGGIECFLTKDVTHFITDKTINKKNIAGQGESSTSASKSQNFKDNNLSNVTFDPAKPKSRADAMLHRARTESDSCNKEKQQLPIQTSSIEIAKSWNIRIWSTEYVVNFLSKVTNAIKNYHNKSSTNNGKHKSENIKYLEKEFIKIDAIECCYRPYYKEFKQFPQIHLNVFNNLGSPFSTTNVANCSSKINKKSNNSKNNKDTLNKYNNMTRKGRTSKGSTATTTTVTVGGVGGDGAAGNGNGGIIKSKLDNTSSDKKCGYCEICNIEYDILKSHVQTTTHKNFVKNSNNYLTIDTLIKTNVNVESFLKLNSANTTSVNSKNNEVSIDQQQNDVVQIGNEYIPPKTRRSNNNQHLLVSRHQSDRLAKLKLKQNNPGNHLILDDCAIPVTENGPSLRSKRETCKRINYTEPKEEEENTLLDKKRGKSSSSLPNNKITKISTTMLSPQTSPTTPPKEAPLLYKVIDKSMSYTKQQPPITPTTPTKITASVTTFGGGEPLSEKNKSPPKNSIRLKIKRVRQSELSLLSDEAENFMFPKREVSDTEDDRHCNLAEYEPLPNNLKSPTTRRNQTDFDAALSKIKLEMGNNGMTRKTIGATLSRIGRGRRRNHLEIFLNDNSDYYKFENPASRLRYQEQMAMEPAQINTKTVEKKEKMIDDEDDNTKVNHHTSPNLTKLIYKDEVTRHTFSFERVPSYEPWYSAFQRQDEGKEEVFEYYGSTAYRKLPYEMGPLPPLPSNCCSLNSKITISINRKKESPRKLKKTKCPKNLPDRKKDKESSGSNDTNTILPNIKKLSERKKKLLDLEYPRKSPREHASTLAILSCLVQQKKKESDSLACSETNSERMDNGSNYEDESDGNKKLVRGNRKMKKRSSEFINVHQLSREIEELLNDALDSGSESVDLDENEKLYAPMNETPDFVDIITTATMPINCVEDRSIQRSQNNKKDRNFDYPSGGDSFNQHTTFLRNTKKRKNRTGWPNNKKRITKREKSNESNVIVKCEPEELNGTLHDDGDGDCEKNNVVRKSNENVYDDDDKLIREQVAKSDNQTIVANTRENDSFISDFHKIKQESDDDGLKILNKNQHKNIKDKSSNYLFKKSSCNSIKEDLLSSFINGTTTTGISDKAENSDIFTVSSDSLNTTLSEIMEIKTEKDDFDSASVKSIFISDDADTISDTNQMITSATGDSIITSPSTTAITNNCYNNKDLIIINSDVHDDSMEPQQQQQEITKKFFTSSLPTKNDFQPIISLKRLDNAHVYNSYSLRSSKLPKKSSGRSRIGNRKKSNKINKLNYSSSTTISSSSSPSKVRKPPNRGWYNVR